MSAMTNWPQVTGARQTWSRTRRRPGPPLPRPRLLLRTISFWQWLPLGQDAPPQTLPMQDWPLWLASAAAGSACPASLAWRYTPARLRGAKKKKMWFLVAYFKFEDVHNMNSEMCIAWCVVNRPFSSGWHCMLVSVCECVVLGVSSERWVFYTII